MAIEPHELRAGEKAVMVIAAGATLTMENTGWTLRIGTSGKEPVRVIPDGLGVTICYGDSIEL